MLKIIKHNFRVPSGGYLLRLLLFLFIIYFLFGFKIPGINPSDSGADSNNPSYPFDFTTMLQDSTDSLSAGSLKLPVLDSLTLDSLLQDSLRIDSLYLDSLNNIDSLKIDSTARLKHFKYQRKEKEYVELKQKKASAFFAKPNPTNYTRTVELDSTGQYVYIKEKVANSVDKIYLKLPLDEYVNLKMEVMNREIWEKIGYQYKLVQDQNELGQLISDITNIEIPLPSAGFLSIFGPNIIKLRINGSVDIHGAWRNESTEGLTASRLGNTRNEPDFSQQVQISVNGTIGDKLKINADWNTERTFEYENQLKITYDGYDDEIVKKVEAGNVSLQTSPLVGGSEALFGVKSQFQFGPFSLTALASQKKGEVTEVNLTGGSEKQEFKKAAFEYSENHYFVDDFYADSAKFRSIFSTQNIPGDPAIINGRIVDIEVWKSVTTNVDEGVERQANLFIDLQPGVIDTSLRAEDQADIPGFQVSGIRLVPLTRDIDYIVNEYAGFISFKTQIQQNDVVAVAYRTEGGDIYGDFIKEMPDKPARIVLKLLKPQNLIPSFKEAWKLQLRNIYFIGGRDVREDGFELDLNYRVEGQEPRNDYEGFNLLRLFGFDKFNASKAPQPDGAFDFLVNRTIIPGTGEIIFPVLEPFGENMPNVLKEAGLRFDEIYDTLKSAAARNNDKNKFDLVGKYSASVTSTFNIGFNVVENSVRVQLNGRELNLGTDYVVDYNIGQVTIRNDAALVPGADLKITYEQNDLFSLASKTLLGLRGLYEFDKKTKLGFSLLNLNQKTLSDKVRIGEEPLNNTIYGVDFQTEIDMPFLTKALDNVISTRENSSLSLKGEFAYMNPDPNTKKSNIVSDNNESIAYIDDFEGSKRTIPIGVSYTSWKDLSPPFDINYNLDPSEILNKKGKAFWYNILPSDVDVNDIWPERTAARQDQQVTVLNFGFRPTTRGLYNSVPNLEENPRENWGGMMKILSSTANNLVEENIEFIEFWLKLDETANNFISVPDGAKLYIDIGKISEDVIPDGKLNHEDGEGSLNDNFENEDQDRGIDFLSNANEEGSEPGNDKAGDDFNIIQGSVIPDDYLRINGTEGNARLTDIGRFPDSEDLNRNFTLDRLNSYFRYEVPLDTNKTLNPFIGDRQGTGWYQFKVPLKDFIDEVGGPSFEIIEYIRVWTDGIDQDLLIRMADFNFVGNQWRRNTEQEGVSPDDSVLTITTISVEEDPGYIQPPGVKRERDRSNPEEEIFKNEQSLRVIVNDLADTESREIIKNLFRPLDVFDYSEMKLFVRGDQNFENIDNISELDTAGIPKTNVYFRFGSDNNNFYEYRQPLRYNLSSGSDGWDEISIEFSQLTTIKEKRTIDTLGTVFQQAVIGKQGHYYGIKGNPTLTRITYFTIGIENPGDSLNLNSRLLDGEFWVNELRVLGADDTPGWAYSFSSSLKLADLLTVTFNASQTDPYFHKLNDRFGSRVDSRSWSTSAKLDVIKLIPANMEGSSLSLNYSHSESFKKPLYKPGTDVLVEAAAEASSNPDSLRQETETVSIKDSWTLSNIKLRIPTDAWYIDETFNNLTFGFNYSKSFSRNPTIATQKSWVWDAKADYSLNLGRDNYFYPAEIPILGEVLKLFEDYRNVKFYYTPQSFSTNLSARRNWNFTQSRTKGREPDIQRDFTASRGASIGWNFTEGGFLNFGIDYDVNITSSLAHLLTINDMERSEADIWNDVFSGNFFGRDNDYRQTFSFKTSPDLPSLFDLNRYFKINFGYRVSYGWKNNFQQEELGRSANYSSSINSGINIRLKSIMDPLLGEDTKAKSKTPVQRNRIPNRKRTTPRVKNPTDDEKENIEEPSDSSAIADTSESRIMQILGTTKMGLKYLLFDYEQISMNFSQTNQRGGGGLLASGTGFNNFFAINQKDANGPSRLFMLGLSNEIGARVPNANLQETYSQKNSLDFKTSRPLWEGAKLDINWKVGWGFNRNTTITTDSLTGDVMITNVAATGNLDRTFFSVPLPFLNSDLKRVNELYNPEAEDQTTNLSNAFLEGLESFPLLAKVPILKDVAKFVPRPNWKFSWSGLEKLPMFEGLAKRIRLDHAYQSSFTEGWKVNPDGDKEIQTQKINFGFSPLIGLDFQFDDLLGGDVGANIKYNVKTNYDLGLATKNVTETFSRDINITASFKKSGFEIPLFGLSLKNDIEISFSYTTGDNTVFIFEMGDNFSEKGKPQNGQKRVTMEPRIRYVMSSRVTLSLFYKRTSVEPEGASKIPPTTTNEAGLDVNISIQ